MAELHQVDEWLTALLGRFTTAERKKLLREVALKMRKQQQQNITLQRSPDGTAFEPRRITARSKKGRVRRKMFTKLKTAKYLKAGATADEATVQFEGKVQRIARVHHYGLRDRVNKRGLTAKYAERPLLGLSDNLENDIQYTLINWIAGE
ncbi:phage virion morphogenesis protein [Erwiniaceae bacterium BAC15a-03b]|uniref:Phage virion morphogenesis protein n=1 Tax=Winslowiella arboricola TaxID=2978220 RepID=A0A9J6PQD9_9GAMM|nr:phage virion morphogenesis protein [Winslowiella arboricola]MCU5773073.1 phage virion morphogenesis protein [Winslowiella arboricola]MCU5777832.1 phage virion morphogenesis protein [Winslowiella arboricola]